MSDSWMIYHLKTSIRATRERLTIEVRGVPHFRSFTLLDDSR